MRNSISEQELTSLILDRYEGLSCKEAYRETTFFYNPDQLLPNGIYVCTISLKMAPTIKLSTESSGRVSAELRLAC